MRLLYRIILNILNCIYSVFKMSDVKNRIAFISRQFNEKPMDFEILENELREICPDMELVFLCRRVPDSLIGKIGYALHLFKQMRVISTSRVVVLDTYCFGVSALKQREDLIVIQIWHAMGALKKFGWSITGKEEGRDPLIAEEFYMHRNYTYYTVSSEACVPGFTEAYGYNEKGPNYDGNDHVIVSPLPRVKLYQDPQYISEAAARVFEKYPELKNEKIVVYAPTNRMGVDISGEIRKMRDALQEYKLVVKAHPLEKIVCEDVIVDHSFSTYEMMCAAECMILDYSAVVFEAVLLEKPMFFYPFDFDRYVEARDFYIDYIHEMPGPVVRTPEELAEIIKTSSFDRKRILEFKNKWVDTSRMGISGVISGLLDERGSTNEQN